MFNFWLIAAAAAVAQRVAPERQDHGAKCRKLGAAIETPTYVDCPVALYTLEKLEQAASSPLNSAIWRGAIVFECGLGIRFADLAGLEP